MATKAAPRAALRRALDQKQLVLFYQPIHELRSGRVVAAEALLRARRRSGEIRNAARLTATAEQGPDLYRLDSWMIKWAFRDAAAWQSDEGPDVRLHVNISPKELEETGLTTRLRKLAKLTGMDARKVNIEITETSFIAKLRPAARALERHRALVALAPPPLPARWHQAAGGVREAARRGRARPHADAASDRARARSRPARDRRGSRARGSAGGAARGRVRLHPGLSLLEADAGGAVPGPAQATFVKRVSSGAYSSRRRSRSRMTLRLNCSGPPLAICSSM